jgi:hypothetical protein
MTDKHICRVCGYFNETAPWGLSGQIPTYEFCPCCGVEFGNQDYTRESTREYRDTWLAKGALWDEPKERPADWDLNQQLRNVPEEYR